ncbi:unnamed protein product [Timema podura]|uniref:Uncharacterized protein n=1 Tax=Timema podura TaxID=61482 RepID=A0ABN7PQS6_TIMPD|nr:unnamed protein product [Timema podura]
MRQSGYLTQCPIRRAHTARRSLVGASGLLLKEVTRLRVTSVPRACSVTIP